MVEKEETHGSRMAPQAPFRHRADSLIRPLIFVNERERQSRSLSPRPACAASRR